MRIDWNSLDEVAVISIAVAVAVGVVAIFSLGVLSLSHRETTTDHSGHATLALTGALLCFAACAAVVLYSIYLIVPPLHH
jgi:NO-binding membrane sensor protein with MHYT domain